MSWSSLISSEDVVAIHAALVPTDNGDGEILLFGGDNHDLTGADHNQFDHTRRFNCRNLDKPLIYVQSPAFDVFCCGHAFLGDGRLLVAGGTAEFPDHAGPIHGPARHFEGHRHCAAYNPSSRAFGNVADMSAQPGHGGRSGGRWYPTLCTLSTGEVFAFQGHPDKDDTRHGNNTSERYSLLTNSWVSLPPIGDVSLDPILYPRLHLLNDGSLFVSSRISGYAQNIRINPWNGTVQEMTPLPDSEYQSFGSPSVLLPLVPDDDYCARILLCGGVRSQLLDLADSDSGWQVVPRNGDTAGLARNNACATLLPTGDMLLTGGTLPNTNDQTGVMQPEIYRTPLNRETGAYIPGNLGFWETINEPATVLRNYHSTALLMPDGRVWTAGGNSAQQPGTPPTATQKQIEIYDPPYPAGPRPTINACPSSIDYSNEFTVGVPNADRIDSVVLMRCGSSTHAFDSDQRAVWLRFRTTDSNTLTATAPPNGNVAPPGPYMLFVVDKEGRPCQYARFISVKPYVPKLAQAMWVHGTSLQIESPDKIARTLRAGFYTEVEGKANTENWFHFAIPSKVIVNDKRLRVGSVMLLCETLSADAMIRDVHIYDGSDKIAEHSGVNLSGNIDFYRFDVPGTPFVKWGVGISIGVRFGTTSSRVMRFKSAGCDFVL